MSSTIAEEIGVFGYRPSVLMDMLAGKRAEVGTKLGAYMRTFSGDCSPSDLETALQVSTLDDCPAFWFLFPNALKCLSGRFHKKSYYISFFCILPAICECEMHGIFRLYTLCTVQLYLFHEEGLEVGWRIVF